MAKIRVLVVDNSALMRRLIGDLLRSDPQFEVVGEAGDGVEALAAISRLRPDVVTLDVDMPRMNGLETLRNIMRTQPTAVVVVSGVTRPEVVIEALQEGAVDFILKPSGTISVDMYKSQNEIFEKLRTAAQVDMQALAARVTTENVLRQARAFPSSQPPALSAPYLIAVATSSGGPQALHTLLAALPADLAAAVVIVQHMPPGFTASLAERLNRSSALLVREAHDGDVLRSGVAYLAPGGLHMRVLRADGMSTVGLVRLEDTPPVRGLRPCANVLLHSVAESFGTAAIVVVLTGMGSDGADGCRAVRAAGGHVLVQDQATSMIYGMPRAAASHAHEVLGLDQIPAALVRLTGGAA